MTTGGGGVIAGGTCLMTGTLGMRASGVSTLFTLVLGMRGGIG